MKNIYVKILAIILCVCITTATLIFYVWQNDAPDIGENEETFTAIESLNISKDFMNSNYDDYNLSFMYQHNDTCWVHTYVVKNISWISYVEVDVNQNDSVALNSALSYPIMEALAWYYPRDLDGFNITLLKIDSDMAKEIICHYIQNETNYNNTIEMKLHLETSISGRYPIWVGVLQSVPHYRVKLDATSGKIIDAYSAYVPQKYVNLDELNLTSPDNLFTAFEGIEIARNYLDEKYSEYALSEISSLTIPCENPVGQSSIWQYEFINQNLSVNKLTHELINISANGTLGFSIMTYEIRDLHNGILHGFFDMDGYSFDQINVDSDEACNLMVQTFKNESWYNASLPIGLSLFGQISGYEFPVWMGHYYTPSNSIIIKINAETGEIIEYYES